MSALDDIKGRLFKRRLRNLLAAQRPPAGQTGEPVHPETAGDITLLFVADDAEQRKQVDKWRDRFRRPGRKVSALGFFSEPIGTTNFDFLAVSTKELSWYGAPQGPEVDKFLRASTDLLLMVGPPDHPVLDYLAALKPARLKVGPLSGQSNAPYHLQYEATGGAAAEVKQRLATIASLFAFTNAVPHPTPAV